jgi:hypothetical protein
VVEQRLSSVLRDVEAREAELSRREQEQEGVRRQLEQRQQEVGRS